MCTTSTSNRQKPEAQRKPGGTEERSLTERELKNEALKLCGLWELLTIN